MQESWKTSFRSVIFWEESEESRKTFQDQLINMYARRKIPVATHLRLSFIENVNLNSISVTASLSRLSIDRFISTLLLAQRL
jgi:hypothetical protein